MIAIRGAITVNVDSKEAILEGTELMLRTIIEENNLNDDEIISIVFSATKDLTQIYPAVAARDLGITCASLLCVQEMYVAESLAKCLRILMHVEKNLLQKDIKHVYLRDAKILRPDLTKKG
ncbi:MAG: chorismate mutase [Vallitaleaceae bacterium]|nr:chorismate mutase [Vallitaleaceae bacterium]